MDRCFQLSLQCSPRYLSAIFSKKQASPSQDHPYFFVSPPSSLRMVPLTFHGWVYHFFTMVFRNLIVSFHNSRMLLLFSPPSQSSFWWTFCHPTYGSLAVLPHHRNHQCRPFYSHSKWIQSRTQMCWCWSLKEYASRLLLDYWKNPFHGFFFCNRCGM